MANSSAANSSAANASAANAFASPGAWKDRRLYPRKHLLWAGRLASGGNEEDCVVLDISASGAMLRLRDADPRPANVAVSNVRLGRFFGRIIWQQGDVAGLSFSARPQQVARAAAQAAPYLALAS